MEQRTLALALVAALNAAAESIENLLSEDAPDEAPAPRASRSKGTTTKPAGKSAKAREEEDEDEEPSAEDIIDAVLAAQKILERADIVKILKTKGKAARASEVSPERRAAVIAALTAAIDDAA